jgi:hypothetical protein
MNNQQSIKPQAVDTKALLVALCQISQDLAAVRGSLIRLAAEQSCNDRLLERLAPLEEALRHSEAAVKCHSIPAFMAWERRDERP